MRKEKSFAENWENGMGDKELMRKYGLTQAQLEKTKTSVRKIREDAGRK